mmetsp:Transcript_84271/g.272759  ORF Transcript_84271/g.272759 Transcript_84271/m.272759 type:complete len:489 (-) Transcript_84271:284-1750(-)
MIDQGGDRLAQAANLERRARELEAQGRLQDAFREYRSALEVLQFVHKWEANPRIKQAVHERLEELVGRAEVVKGVIHGSTQGQPHLQAGSQHQLPSPPPPPKVDGRSCGEADPEDRERERLRKGLEGAIMTEKPDVRWDDVAGLKAAKDALQETVILPARFPQLFTGKREPWHGVLLYGPPGTGKSFLAKACATEADATFFSISSSDLVSKWMGESERLVRSLFEMARENRPAVIFIDEVDSLCGARGASGESDAARRIKTEFLAQMDGVGKSSSQILILGATNTPWDLDTAIRRRFEKRVYIPLPDAEARTRLLDLCLGNTPHRCQQEDFARIAQRTEGFSGADISVLVRDAMYEPVRRCRSATAFLCVTRPGADGAPRQRWSPCSPDAPGAVQMTLMQIQPEELLEPEVMPSDFEAALKKVRPSVSPSDLRQFQTFTQMYGMEGNAEDTAGPGNGSNTSPAVDSAAKPLFGHDLGCKASADTCICS